MSGERISCLGHRVIVDGVEYFNGPDGSLYRAPLSCPIHKNGYRMGARFECVAHMADAYIERLVAQSAATLTIMEGKQ